MRKHRHDGFVAPQYARPNSEGHFVCDVMY
jgi:hypothetical protein